MHPCFSTCQVMSRILPPAKYTLTFHQYFDPAMLRVESRHIKNSGI